MLQEINIFKEKNNMDHLFIFTSVLLEAFMGSNGVISGYVGCFKDNFARLLKGPEIVRQEFMSNALCIRECFSLGYPYSGTEYGRECFCGDGEHLTINVKRDDAECNDMMCLGNRNEYCGGYWRIAVYSTDTFTTFLCESRLNNRTGNSLYQCYCLSNHRFITRDGSVILNAIKKRQKLLQVKKTKTSKYIRGKTCAKDERWSSKALGSLGIIIIALYWVAILSFDILNAFLRKSKNFSHMCKTKTKSVKILKEKKSHCQHLRRQNVDVLKIYK